MKWGEFELISEIKRRFPPTRGGAVGIGDDCAVIEHHTLVTTDALVDGVHFDGGRADYLDLGYKAMAVNISDLAASGGGALPMHAFLTLGIPPEMTDGRISRFLDGIAEIRAEFPFDIMGGDTVRSGVFFISVTMMARAFGRPVLRSGAKKGDYIYVTGTLGDSGIGLALEQKRLEREVADPAYFVRRHYRPSPRVALMAFLLREYEVRSCIDISDGLLGDLGHIAEESGGGFFLDLGELPLAAGKIGKGLEGGEMYFLDFALNGGEDYELAFTSPEQIDAERVLKKTGVPVANIGYITDGPVTLVRGNKEFGLKELSHSFRHF